MVGMNRHGFWMIVGLMFALTFAAAEAKGPVAPDTSANAIMLDHNEFPCSNCLFGIADYYFCFDAGGKILIGHDKVRTQKWWQHTPAALMERGKTVPIRFDDRYIWVPQPKGKDLRLTQDYTKKIFLNSDRCQAAVK
jgi:hypothetical protein